MQKGYISAEPVGKKLDKLESALMEKEGIIAELRKDKEFLRSRINALQNSLKADGGDKA